MLYRIENAAAHRDHTVIVCWSDGVEAAVDFRPIVAKGKVYSAMQDPGYFVDQMRVSDDRLGLEWPNRVDFSADGLRFMAFPDEEAAEFGAAPASSPAAA